jgi:hypothetical protein
MGFSPFPAITKLDLLHFKNCDSSYYFETKEAISASGTGDLYSDKDYEIRLITNHCIEHSSTLHSLCLELLCPGRAALKFEPHILCHGDVLCRVFIHCLQKFRKGLHISMGLNLVSS